MIASVRFRTAVAAGLASALILSGGALWFRTVLWRSYRAGVDSGAPASYTVETIAPVDRALKVGVPAGVLLIMVVAWIAARRALRPVEAIRAQLADITARSLDRRVPVPNGRDEVARLAITTNQTLDRLQRAAEQQRRFVTDASHELRTPIATLRSALEVALAERDFALVDQALTDTQRLQALAIDLLLLARFDNPQPASTELVDLTALAYEMPDVHIHASEPAPVRGNPLHLHRLLRNLVDNAHQYARNRIDITITIRDGWTICEITDDGPGIPQEHHETVFGRFTRLDHARARDTGGTGLGLAIAREIAHHHNGTLVLEPSATGAHFTLRLPNA